MAAPSSAQTSPSHSARTAPAIQPSMACGPPAALTISGMVMNGPTPIMSIMLSVVAPAKPTPRISSGCPAGLLWLMAHAQQIHIKADRSGHAERQLPEERVSGIDVVALAVLRHQQAAFLWLLVRIIRGKQRRVVRVPLVDEVEPTLLHPALEVMQGNLVGIVQDHTVRVEDGDRRLFDGDSLAAESCGKRRVMACVEVAGRRVVLHQQRTAVTHIVEQALVVLLNIVARVVGADAKNNGAETAEISVLHIVRRQQGDVEANLAKHRGNIVPRAHDVADLETLWDLHFDHAGPLQRRLVIEEATDVGPRDQAVAFVVIATA